MKTLQTPLCKASLQELLLSVIECSGSASGNAVCMPGAVLVCMLTVVLNGLLHIIIWMPC